jgi:hypothetical protein
MKQMNTINQNNWKRFAQSRAMCVSISLFMFLGAGGGGN